MSFVADFSVKGYGENGNGNEDGGDDVTEPESEGNNYNTFRNISAIAIAVVIFSLVAAHLYVRMVLKCLKQHRKDDH